MKSTKLIALLLFMSLTLWCCEEDEDKEPERTTHTIQLSNALDAMDCIDVFVGPSEPITFIVSYRDIQVDVDVLRGQSGIINVLVEDNETINIIVQNLNGELRSNANVNFRTTSRPDNLSDSVRVVEYCNPFSLQFANF